MWHHAAYAVDAQEGMRMRLISDSNDNPYPRAKSSRGSGGGSKRLILVMMAAALIAAAVAGGVVLCFGDEQSDAAATEVSDEAGLRSAISSATSEGAVIKVMQDIVISGDVVTIDGGKKIELDLNGNTISRAVRVFEVQNAEVTITGPGTIRENDDDGYSPVVIKGSNTSTDEDYTKVTVGQGVVLRGWAGLFVTPYQSTGSPYAYGVKIDFAGTIVSPADDNHTTIGHGIYVNGQIKHEGNCPEITIREGSSITSKGPGIYAAGYAEWNIQGGSIIGAKSGIAIKAGVLNITGGTIGCTGDDTSPTEGYSNGVNASGAALQIESNNSYAGKIAINISGGSQITSKNGYAIYEYLADGTTESKVNSISISGGVFASGAGKKIF
jgi:hypothetical protein